MTRRRKLIAMVELRQQLDVAIKENREHFLSDWNGDHSFVELYLGPELLNPTLEKPLPSKYLYFDEQTPILNSIRSFHLEVEGLDISSNNMLAGPGSSSILAAFALWILYQGWNEVFYVPPLYYTLHYFLQLVGVGTRPVTGKQVFEAGSSLNLPKKKTVLLLCDPVWYAGYPIPDDKILQIAEWQGDTGSLVFVDGSFQYMKWTGKREEATSRFDPELTFRLISPTKSLAIPFFRFAYLLHPSSLHTELLFLYENLVGGVSISDVKFANRSMAVLRSVTNNRDLCSFLSCTFEELLAKGLIETTINPDCGYFIFAEPKAQLPNPLMMDQEYFELKNYPRYARINLMGSQRLLRSGKWKV